MRLMRALLKTKAISAILFILPLSLANCSDSNKNSHPQNQITLSNEEAFAALGNFTPITELNDYSVINSFSGSVLAAHPTSAEEVALYVKAVRHKGEKLRIRGRGHSMNGTSIPKQRKTQERILFTDQLDYYEILGPKKVKLGAGIAIFAAKNYLARKGLSLRIYNDGQMLGPSVGGYVSASGFGNRSGTFGGFWETVESMTIVDGLGKIKVIDKSDPMFKWFFGSMGQIGVIVDVTLKVDKLGSAKDSSIANIGNIPFESYAKTPMYQHPPHSIFWFTVFAPPARETELKNALTKIMGKHPDALNYTPIYNYQITYKNFNPPLMYPHPETFIALGIWGSPKDYQNVEKLSALEREIHRFVLQNPELYRYIQTEYIPSVTELKTYFSEDIRSQFLAIKQKLDPDSLFPYYL